MFSVIVDTIKSQPWCLPVPPPLRSQFGWPPVKWAQLPSLSNFLCCLIKASWRCLQRQCLCRHTGIAMGFWGVSVPSMESMLTYRAWIASMKIWSAARLYMGCILSIHAILYSYDPASWKHWRACVHANHLTSPFQERLVYFPEWGKILEWV